MVQALSCQLDQIPVHKISKLSIAVTFQTHIGEQSTGKEFIIPNSITIFAHQKHNDPPHII